MEPLPDLGLRGAYGFRLSGVPEAAPLLIEAPAHWPRLELRHRRLEGTGPPGDRVERDRVELRLHTGGWVELDRTASHATFHLPRRPADGALVHPYLAPVAALASRWLGRESFHAGAFVAGGGAWALVGDKGSGKSSTLAQLMLDGHDVVTDDILVLQRDLALAGPRCLDLRAGAAARLGGATPLGVVGLRERWRMPLGAVEPELPLRGWVTLAWDDRPEVRVVRGAERLLSLTPHRAVRLPPQDPGVLVHLSSLPLVELRRPRLWQALPDATARLLDALARVM